MSSVSRGLVKFRDSISTRKMGIRDSDKVGLNRDQFEIKLSSDKERRLLTVSDNGIGMSHLSLLFFCINIVAICDFRHSFYCKQ